MDASNVPRRPPPPPPIDSSSSLSHHGRVHHHSVVSDEDGEEGMPLHRGIRGGDYTGSPPTSPPSFADALGVSSPTGLYWQGDRRPIPQEDSDDDGDSPPLYSSGSEAPPMAGLGERLGALMGYRDHEPEPEPVDDARNVPQHDHQPHHHTPPPPFPEDDEDEDIPRQPPLLIITGATTGLGLALFNHFAAKPKSSPDVPYDVLGIDKTPWRVPGTGFRWQTPVGHSGMFTQLDLTARPARLESWAQTYLYSQPVRTRRSTVRYPRPVRLVVHCAASGARGLVEQPAADKDGQQQAAAAARRRRKKRTEPVAEVLRAVREEDLESFEVMNAETMRRTFDANVVATLQLVQMVTPHLQLEASTRDEDLGVMVDATTTTGRVSFSSSSEEDAHDTPASEAGQDHVTKQQQPQQAPAGGGGGGGHSPNNLDWLEALKKEGSRASLHVGSPPPPPKSTQKRRREEEERPLPSAPRDGIPAPRVVVVSSHMGSVASNAKGGAYAFRASLAALHAVVRSLSLDVPEVCFACVYPGELAVAPTKGRPKSMAITGALVKMEGEEEGEEEGLLGDSSSIMKRKRKGKPDDVISCEDSVRGLLPMLERLGEGTLRTGCFVDRFGDPIPW